MADVEDQIVLGIVEEPVFLNYSSTGFRSEDFQGLRTSTVRDIVERNQNREVVGVDGTHMVRIPGEYFPMGVA